MRIMVDNLAVDIDNRTVSVEMKISGLPQKSTRY